MTRASAPCSSANLGPGFDALAIALDLRVEVEVTEHDGPLTIETSGEGSDRPANAGHLAARVATRIARHDRLRIRVHSDIPVGRGLGSSAALAVTAAAAAGDRDPLGWGFRIDGHPENAAASVLGGLIAATVIDGAPIAAGLPLDPALRFVVVVPDTELATERARAALPGTIPLADAAFNLSRLGVLVAALGDRSLLTPELMEDRVHQAYRAAALYPESTPMLEGLVAAGALASCWSGAGPTLMAVCDGDDRAAKVRATGEGLLVDHGFTGRALVLAPDQDGLRID